MRPDAVRRAAGRWSLPPAHIGGGELVRAAGPAASGYSFCIGTPPMSISRTVPALPKSIVTVARTPAPSDATTVPRPYLSWLTRSPTSRCSAGASVRSGTFQSPRSVAVGRRPNPNRPTGAERSGRHPPPLDEVVGHLGEEPGRRVGARLPEGRAHHRPGQVEPLLRAGDPDVGQPALLGQLLRIAHRPHVREHPVLPAGEEHDRELQALRRVQGHQRDHARVVVRDRVGVGDQRHPLQERGQRARLGHAGAAGLDTPAPRRDRPPPRRPRTRARP